MSTTDELPSVAEFWDAAAESFDEDADHGLRDVEVREAWRARLVGWLPPAPADALDLGCGTGSLSLLLAELGHRVVGVDLSGAMVAAARDKCAGRAARFEHGDAADPALGDARFDVVLARHLLWTLPDPQAALARWVGLLRPGGRLVLVEGRWTVAGDTGDTGGYARDADTMPWHGGVRAEELTAALDPLVDHLQVVCLSHDPLLWGREVDDERFAIVAAVPGPPAT